jgi:hypothetical protein
MVTGQTSASALSTLPTAEGAIPEEVAPMEGSALLGVNAGSSRALVHASDDLHTWEGPTLWWPDQRNLGTMLFTLDDTTESKDWEKVETGVELTASALNTVLGTLRDVINPIGQVRHVRASRLDFPLFCASNLCYM